MSNTKHGPDTDCPACYECPGCDGGSGADPVNSYLDMSRPAIVSIVCLDCRGATILCPNYDPELAAPQSVTLP